MRRESLPWTRIRTAADSAMLTPRTTVKPWSTEACEFCTWEAPSSGAPTSAGRTGKDLYEIESELDGSECCLLNNGVRSSDEEVSAAIAAKVERRWPGKTHVDAEGQKERTRLKVVGGEGRDGLAS